MGKIEVVLGDITKIKADAIVNAANASLLRGGGVDGAIHRAAGIELEEECIEIGGCPTGEARITQSYNLQSIGIGWIIHAVGPRWLGGFKDEEKLLKNAYKNSLNLSQSFTEVYPKQCIEILKKHIVTLDEKIKIQIMEEALDVAKSYVKEHPIKTIAFPSISTGVYHFPLEKAAHIAINTIKEFLDINSSIEKVMLVCFDKETYSSYLKEL
ncbi:MAG: macro domain-containing protein [Clostridium lundense]|nr:macro domain-containing protein [Clostridium lundense]